MPVYFKALVLFFTIRTDATVTEATAMAGNDSHAMETRVATATVEGVVIRFETKIICTF